MRPRTENERRSGKTHDVVVASGAEIAGNALRTQSGNVKCITTLFSGNSHVIDPLIVLNADTDARHLPYFLE